MEENGGGNTAMEGMTRGGYSSFILYDVETNEEERRERTRGEVSCLEVALSIAKRGPGS
jgi:hypothetical protein